LAGTTGIRRDGEKVALYLLGGLAYDPESLGAEARKHEERKRFDVDLSQGEERRTLAAGNCS